MMVGLTDEDGSERRKTPSHVYWYFDDHLSGTHQLDPEETGFHDKLINLFFKTQGHLPADPIALTKLTGWNMRVVKRLLHVMISKHGKWHVTSDGLLYNERARTELLAAQKRKKKAVIAAEEKHKKQGKSSGQSQNTGNQGQTKEAAKQGNPNPNPHPKPSISTKKSGSKEQGCSIPDDFPSDADTAVTKRYLDGQGRPDINAASPTAC